MEWANDDSYWGAMCIHAVWWQLLRRNVYTRGVMTVIERVQLLYRESTRENEKMAYLNLQEFKIARRAECW